jgi:hypothetical protein
MSKTSELYGINIPSADTADWTASGTKKYQITNAKAVLTAGAYTSDASYDYYTVTVSGDLVCTAAGLGDLFMVGGGGGGGGETGDANGAGGGGGGGVTLITNYQFPAGTYPIVIGAGGAGSVGNGTGAGATGSSTTFNGIYVNGGYGGRGHTAATYPQDGGDSGFMLLSGFSVDFHYGGLGVGGSPYRGGGGGGAGADGATGASSADGGAGYQLDWDSNYYGGGGGGGGRSSNGAGGNGGGGAGGAANQNGTDGSPNTGGGGGGSGWWNATNNGGNGGSGIVIIRIAK